MDYPSSFETPAFPAGRRIAISRAMSIGILIGFLVIVLLCGLLVWMTRSQRLNVFLISRDGLTDQWQVVTHNKPGVKFTAVRNMQESVVGNFVMKWFALSDSQVENEKLWKSCDRNSCQDYSGLLSGDSTCALYCSCSEGLFNNFVSGIVPNYKKRAAQGERLVVNSASLVISPVDTVGDTGGTWRVRATVLSNLSGEMDIVAFVKVAQNAEDYPNTLGFYVTNFYAYRLK